MGLVCYDKWCKEDSIVYKHRESIFDQISKYNINGDTTRRIQSVEEELVDKDMVILDFGCGTGIYTEMLCKTFITDSRDTLLCMDISPQCIQFVRNNVVENNKTFDNAS